MDACTDDSFCFFFNVKLSRKQSETKRCTLCKVEILLFLAQLEIKLLFEKIGEENVLSSYSQCWISIYSTWHVSSYPELNLKINKFLISWAFFFCERSVLHAWHGIFFLFRKVQSKGDRRISIHFLLQKFANSVQSNRTIYYIYNAIADAHLSIIINIRFQSGSASA